MGDRRAALERSRKFCTGAGRNRGPVALCVLLDVYRDLQNLQNAQTLDNYKQEKRAKFKTKNCIAPSLCIFIVDTANEYLKVKITFLKMSYLLKYQQLLLKKNSNEQHKNKSNFLNNNSNYEQKAKLNSKVR